MLRRLVVVSNRLPVAIESTGKRGGRQLRPSVGGLVTALAPIMEENHGLWIGWPGWDQEPHSAQLLQEFNRRHAYELRPVWLNAKEVDGYYRGFSNETLWPLFHDLLGYCKFETEHWQAYTQANHHFAQVIAAALRADDFVWVHDYQLTLVAQHLRAMQVQHRLSFFLHIPFPSLDLFRRLPWKQNIIQALMEYDLLGFQTLRDRRNFIQCVKGLIPQVAIEVRRRYSLIHYGPRMVKVGHFPIGIDFEEFNRDAQASAVAENAQYFRRQFGSRTLILGVDRLDYTKGIPERFLAFERALEKYPDLQGKVSLFQVVVPSRTHVPYYQDLKEILEGMVGRINGRFSRLGWIPIHYMYRMLDRVKLLGCYRACEIALVTPLRDGMNLVAKEYCTSTVDGNGVLILSEFAGAADQLAKGALIVNPYDREKMADAIYRAFTMELGERRERMRVLRAQIRRNDVHRWVQWFLESDRSTSR